MTQLYLVAMVALGGAVGAMGRFLLAHWRTPRFPFATFIANVAGSFLLGFLAAGSSESPLLLLMGVGFCGSLTTFSTFSLDTLVLAREGRRGTAVVNVIASVAACVAAVAAGLALGLTVFSR